MRLRSSHLLIVIAIALLLLAVAAFVQTRKREPAREHPGSATATDRFRSAAPKPSGRERCIKKCAALHKGYVYRAEQDLGASGTRRVEPEVCTCV